MSEAWEKKRSLSKSVSNSRIDEIYSLAISAGALGGKLSGAGGGGFLQLYVPMEKQAKVKKILSKLLYVPFKMDQTGSQIIFYEPQKEYTEEESIRDKKILNEFIELKNIN